MARFTKPVGAAVLRLEVTQQSQNVTANTSVVRWSLHLDCSNGESRHLDPTIGWNVRLGVPPANNPSAPPPVVGQGTYGFDFRTTSTVLIGQGTTTVAHAADGRRTIQASGFSADTGTSAIGYPGTVQGGLTLSRIPKPASAPRTVTVGAVTPSSVGFSWTAPADNGGAAITRYRIQYARNKEFTDSVELQEFTDTSGTVTGLDSGFTYWFRVAALNSRGLGAYSTAVSRAVGLPAPVLTEWVRTAGDALRAQWQAPAIATGLTGYRLQLARDAAFTQGVQHIDLGDTLTHTVAGLPGGRIWWARVAARTGNGINAYSAARSVMLVVDAGDLDNWYSINPTTTDVVYATEEQLRRGVVGTASALYREALTTGPATLPAGAGIERVTTVVPGRSYRFAANARLTGASLATTYVLAVDGQTSDPITVTSQGVQLEPVEFIATGDTVRLKILLDEPATASGASDGLETVAFSGIKLWQLGTDYPMRLRETVYESNLANHFDLACNSVGASWYVDAYGITRFRLPGAALPTVATFTDEPDDTALHYVDINAAYDTRSLINRVDLTNLGVDETRTWEENTELVATDESSIAAYGVRSEGIEVNLWEEPPYDTALQWRMDELLAGAHDPGLLISSIVWNAQEALEYTTALDVGQRINVRYRGTSQDSQIVSIDHTITPTRWLITLGLRRL